MSSTYELRCLLTKVENLMEKVQGKERLLLAQWIQEKYQQMVQLNQGSYSAQNFKRGKGHGRPKSQNIKLIAHPPMPRKSLISNDHLTQFLREKYQTS